MATLSGNIGEWSEPYVVLRLAADGVLHQADEHLAQSADNFAKILKIKREDLTAELAEDGAVMFRYGERGVFVPAGEAEVKAKRLLHSILSVKKASGAFALPELEDELRTLGFTQLKNPVPKNKSFTKKDLSLVIEDPNTGITPTLGFSVKSELGGAPTLLNASSHTNIRYRIYGINDSQMKAINGIKTASALYDRCENLKSVATEIQSDGYESEVFQNNLRLVDGDLPMMVAEVVKAHYFDRQLTIKDAVQKVSSTPRYADCDPVYCSVKTKRFLRACALGMVPSVPWKDIDEASGGYIIVLPSGELIAFYIYNRQLFDEYLFANTKFEHPSSQRYRYGVVEKVDGKYFIRLNLQIRFTR